MEKIKLIKPADVFVTEDEYTEILHDRANGIPHTGITDCRRKTGNIFIDLFVECIDCGGGVRTASLAGMMGVNPALLSPAIEAMSGLSAREWAMQYVHLRAYDRLRHDPRDISSLASSLGFRSVSAFSHFFYRREGCYPTDLSGEKYHYSSRAPRRRRRS